MKANPAPPNLGRRCQEYRLFDKSHPLQWPDQQVIRNAGDNLKSSIFSSR